LASSQKRILALKVIKGIGCFLTTLEPVRLVTLGYLSYIMVGWLLLCLPVAQRASGVRCLDNLFIAVSAVSTTGLVTVNVSDCYTVFGQIIILLLIQLGGVGYMTIGSFVILARGRDLSDLRSKISQRVFSLPDDFRIDKFIRSVVLFALIVELIGAIALYPIFSSAGLRRPLWNSVFHSVSAFCTAGFSLFANNMESFSNNFRLNVVIGFLSMFGAIGFIVLVDIWRRITGKIRQITFTSSIILRMSFGLLIIGTILLLVTEPAFKSMPPDSRVMASVFQAMSAMTTVGFNTIPIGSLADSSLIVLTFLMIIGASPSGTGGGIKSTSFTALFAVIRSALKRETKVCFLGKVIPTRRVQAAMANVGFYLFILLLGIFALTLTEPMSFKDLFFEAASALGTVGLSTGITTSLSVLGKVTICALMFIGRLGPLTFAIALSAKPSENLDKTRHDVAI
jgi:trk system potassium uptake protein TrkH